VDRNFGDAHGIWVVNPDGTARRSTGRTTPPSRRRVRPAHHPGTQNALAILGQHHDRLWGALAIVDRKQGHGGREAVLRTWPAEAVNIIRTGGGFDCDAFGRFNPKYEDPWPLSAKYFLCSRMIGKGDQMGIYLVDTFGNEVLLHYEAPGCYDPMPLAARPRPPVIANRRTFDGAPGYVVIQDVYQGTHMKGVRRGEIKYIRVVESPAKKKLVRRELGRQGYQAPGMNWHDSPPKGLSAMRRLRPTARPTSRSPRTRSSTSRPWTPTR